MHVTEVRWYRHYRITIRCMEVSPGRFEAAFATFPPLSGGWIQQDFPRSTRAGAIQDAWQVATERIASSLADRPLSSGHNLPRERRGVPIAKAGR